MKKKGSRKAKKRFLILSIVFLGIVFLSFASIFHDWVQIIDNKNEIASLTNYYSKLMDEE